MGILNGPRINFWGGIKTNVCVANNDEAVPQVNNPPLGNRHILDLPAARVGRDGEHMSDDQIIALMRAPGPNGYYTGGGWNYYGDHQVTFANTVISSTGTPGTRSTEGALINQNIYLLGSVDPKTKAGPYMSSVMVDVDPTASISTQIFIGGLMIGSPEDPLLHIVEDVVASSHNVFTVGPNNTPENQGLVVRQFFRDPDGPGSAWASGTFQVTFSKDSIVKPNSGELDPAIKAILNATCNGDGADGITLRFQMFEMFPELTTDELVQAYEDNTNPSNPSVGRVVGTLGPHFPGEPMTVPPGRELHAASTNLVGYFEVDSANKLMMLDALQLYPKGYFRDNRKNIGSDFPIEPNVDYGTNTLKAGSSSVTFDADPNDYYLYGGILDIPLGNAATDVTDFPVFISGQKTVTLAPQGNQISGPGLNGGNKTAFSATESSFRIYGDPRNIYIDDHTGELELTFNVSFLGRPVPLFDEPGGEMSVSTSAVATGTLPVGDFLTYTETVGVPGGSTSFSLTIADNGKVDDFGFMTLVLTGNRGGSCFFNIRKYPKTTFGIDTGATLDWPTVYENALRFFYVTFPAMNMRFPLNDEGVIEANAEAIKNRISHLYRPTSLYMPITRSMTPSQRALLTQFLDRKTWTPLSGAAPLPIVPVRQQVAPVGKNSPPHNPPAHTP